MADGAYKQEKLNSQKPFKQSPDVEAVIDLSVHCNDSNFEFRMEQVTGPLDFLSKKGGRYFIHVTKDTKVTLRLTGKTNWRWSNDYDGITTKRVLAHLYGKIEYSEQEKDLILEERKADEYGAKVETPFVRGFKAMAFYAKHDREGAVGTSHAFNLNIDFQQPDGGWLPVTIDPDIKNPYTPGN